MCDYAKSLFTYYVLATSIGENRDQKVGQLIFFSRENGLLSRGRLIEIVQIINLYLFGFVS